MSNDNKSLVHDTWINTMVDLQKTHSEGTLSHGLAKICEGVLRTAGLTPEMRDFLDQEALKIMESEG